MTLAAVYDACVPARECSHDRPRLVRDLIGTRDRWYVDCSTCGDAGPEADTAAEAIGAWLEIVEVLAWWAEHAVQPSALADLVAEALRG